MRESLSKTFRTALAEAQSSARQFNQDFVGSEHLMLGLLATDGEGTRTLRASHADPVGIVAALKKVLPTPEQAPVVTGDLPLSPKAQRVINGAIVKAQALREPKVSSRFLLLSLLDEPDGEICKAIRKVGTDIESLQMKLAEKPTSIEE